MAAIDPKNPLGKGPSFRGGFYSYYLNGRWIAAAWPKKRRPPVSEYHKLTVKLFQEAAMAAKLTDPYMQADLAAATAGTPYYARDIMYMLWYGQIGVIETIDGQRFYPMPVRANVSMLLDNLGFAPGTMLFRGQNVWLPVQPGTAGQVLRFSSLDAAPVWGAPAPAGLPAVTIAHRTSDQSTSASWPKIAPLQATSIDDLGAWSAGAPTRLTVPDGITRARLTGNVQLTLSGTARAFHISIIKNGSTTDFPGKPEVSLRLGTTGFTDNAFQVSSGWLPVTAGDYFELRVNADGTYTAGFLEPTWFQMEAA